MICSQPENGNAYNHIAECMKMFGYDIRKEDVSHGISLLLLISAINDDSVKIRSLLIEVNKTLFPICKSSLDVSFKELNNIKPGTNETQLSPILPADQEKTIYKNAYQKMALSYNNNTNLNEIKNIFSMINEGACYIFDFLHQSIKKSLPLSKVNKNKFPLLLPKVLKYQKSQIAILSKFSGFYTLEELICYFQILHCALTNISCPVVLLLVNSSHSFAVGYVQKKYEPSKKAWVFTDSDNLEMLYTEHEEEIAQKIFHVFSSNSYVTFETRIFSSNEIAIDVVKKLSLWCHCLSWKNIHTVSAIKATQTDSEGYSWLMVAARNGHFKLVKRLINFGSDPNLSLNDGYSAFNFAILSGYLKMIKYLIMHGANISNPAFCDSDILYCPCEDGQYSVTKFLLKKGVNPRKADCYGFTPLYGAALNGHLKIANLLLKHSANPNHVNKYGNSSLYIASCNGHLEIVKLLVKNGANVNIANKSGITPLLISSLNGHANIIDFLLANGANPNHSDNNGNTSLILAAQKCHSTIVALLLENIDYHPAHSEIAEALKRSACNGHIEVVKVLLNYRAKTNSIEQSINYLLLVSSENGHFDIAQYSLYYGANPNFADQNGNTPLFFASQNGHIKLIKLLLENNTNPNYPCSNEDTPLLMATMNNHLDAVNILLNNNANPNQANKAGMTPILMASRQGYLKIVKILLNHGANYNLYNNNGNTPLHLAAFNNHVEVVKILLGKKANPNSTNIENITPLFYASKEGYFDIINLLLAKGALVNISNNDGETPLITAIKNRHSEVAKLLLFSQLPQTISGKNNQKIYFSQANIKIAVSLLCLIEEQVPELIKLSGICRGVACVAAKMLLDYKYELFRDNFISFYIFLYPIISISYIEILTKTKNIGTDNLSQEFNSLSLSDRYNLISKLDASIKKYIKQYLNIFNLETTLKINNMKNLLRNIKYTQLHSNDNLQFIDQFSCIYNKDDLVTYFKTFRSTFFNVDYPIAIVLFNLSHCITIGYSKCNERKNRFIFIDANHLPDREIEDENILSQEIISAFSEKDCVCLRSCIAVAFQYRSDAKILLDNWHSQDGYKKIHTVTTDKAKKVDSQGGFWLLQAVLFNHEDTVKELLRNGADVNMKFHSEALELYPLAITCNDGYLNIAKHLIEFNADVNTPSSKGTTPLMIAIARKRAEISKLLLDNGANPYIERPDGTTALMLAAQNGLTEITKTLLDRGANPNRAHSSGVTPLMLAAKHGELEIVKLLLNYGADKKQEYPDGTNAFMTAVEHGELEIVKYLLDHDTDFNKRRKDGFTTLMLAVKGNSQDIVDLLLKHGANPNLVGLGGVTALMLSVKHKKTTIVKILLNYGADVNQEDDAGNTSVSIVAEYGNDVLLNILTSYGVNPNQVLSNGMTLLMLAAKYKNKDIFNILLKASGNDINRCYAENVPLSNIIRTGYIASANVILNNEAEYTFDSINSTLEVVMNKWRDAGAHTKKEIYLMKEYILYISKFANNYKILNAHSEIENKKYLITNDYLKKFNDGEIFNTWTERFEYILSGNSKKSISDFRFMTNSYDDIYIDG